MDLGERIGWGVIIYAIVFLAWSGMTIYGWTQGIWPALAELFVLLLVCIWAGSRLKFRSWGDMLSYSIGWAIIFAALDSLFVVPTQGWGIYTQWTSWVGYAMIALLPLLATFLKRRNIPMHRAWES